jgi:hypothetical protein
MTEPTEPMRTPETFPMTHEEMTREIKIWRLLAGFNLAYPNFCAATPEDWAGLRRLMVELSYYFDLD